jgi:hypothetical protein
MTQKAVRASLGVGLGLAVTGLCGCWGVGAAARTPSCNEAYPLGTLNQAHYEAMHAKGRAAAFILHQNDFLGSTSELSPAGKDHVLEIVNTARTVPFPVLIERCDNNANPSLDERRRASVAQVLADLGIADAQQRTSIAPAAEKGLSSAEAESQAAMARD